VEARTTYPVRAGNQAGNPVMVRERYRLSLEHYFTNYWRPRSSKAQPHFESPQFKHVMQPSIITTAAVLHLLQSWAPSGK
jgi:hypothetical protein